MSEELDPDRISRLLADSVAGSLGPEDAGTLRRWAESSPQNKRLLEALSCPEPMRQAVGELRSYHTEKAWARVTQRANRKRNLRLVGVLTGVAAAVAVAVGLWLPTSPNAIQILPAALPQQSEVAAVRLYKASGEVVLVDTMRRIALKEAVAESDAQSLKVLSDGDSHKGATVYNTVEVPHRKTFEVTLSDGTQVMLNAGSSLRFPESFSRGENREVYLDGEAYFTVSKDVARPFIVHTDDGYVRVTGTEFNVSSYADAEATLTTLVEGRVLVGGIDTLRELPLLPGMQAMQNRRTGTVTTGNVDVAEFTAWKSGTFAFTERPLREIMTTMSRWYGCRVIFEQTSQATLRFSGQIARDRTLEEVAEFFSRTKELKVTVRDGVLTVH